MTFVQHPTRVAFAALILMPASALAGNLHVQVSGGGANGFVDDQTFSGADWTIEFDVDDTVSDSNSATESGSYAGIVGGRIEIDGSLFELGGDSISGTLTLEDYGTSQRIFVHPSSGGFLQFVVGTTLYPALADDVNDLSTVHTGVSVSNAEADDYNNSSILNFPSFNCSEFGLDPDDPECEELQEEMPDESLSGESGEIIDFSAGSSADGSMSVSLSTSPVLQTETIEPLDCDGALLTGADLLADGSVSFPSRAPVADGDSVFFDTGESYTTLIDIPLAAAGDFSDDDRVVVTATIDRTREGEDDDLNVVVSDGTTGVGVAAQDNYAGILIGYQLAFSGADYSFADETFLTSGSGPLGAIGEQTIYDLEVDLSCDTTSATGSWGEQSGAADFGVSLDRAGGLSLSIVGENGDEAYTIHQVCVSVEVVDPLDSCVDTDGDGLTDDVDACPSEDASGLDTDGDGCTDDSDGDGVTDDLDVCDGYDDTADADTDGVPDGCDVCGGDDASGDSDSDLVCDDSDACVGDDASGDSDGDLFCDDSDSCPADANTDQADDDGDGQGDACDDDDADGVLDVDDACLDTASNDAVLDSGCSVDQLCPCDDDCKNHGEYQSCVSQTAEDMHDAGVISEDEKDDISSASAQSDCGKSDNGNGKGKGKKK